MAENTTVAEAPAACVWEVLADPDTYAVWVVGAKDIRDWEGRWPEPGSRFHHSQGVGPLTLVQDYTEVLEAAPERRLLLEARMRPLAVLHIELGLEPLGTEQTRIRMSERPVAGPLLVARPVVGLALKGRNVEGLERLKALAEQRWRGRRSALGSSA